MDGVTASRRLREASYSNLIIGITGNVMEEDLVGYLDAGADAVFFKPVKMALITQVLELASRTGPRSKAGHKLKLEVGADGRHSLMWFPLTQSATSQLPTR